MQAIREVRQEVFLLAFIVATLLVIALSIPFLGVLEVVAQNEENQELAANSAIENHFRNLQAAASVAYSPSKEAPVRLLIPSIGVDAAVENVGIGKSGSMAVPLSYDNVGWYRYGPPPGSPGSAVIAGHLDTRTSPDAVFQNLSKLKIGDEVQIEDSEGEILVFSVTDIKRFPYNDKAPEVFAATHESSLNLVTCEGTWLPEKNSYDKRLVVFTERIR